MPGDDCMPRRPDTPCTGCGKMMWRGTGSRPPGEAMCRPCRAIRRGQMPGEKQRDLRDVPKTREVECEHCGLTVVRKRSRGQVPRFCSDRCQSSAYAKRRAAYQKRGRLSQRMKDARAKARRASRGVPAPANWAWCQGECVRCGEYFVRKSTPSSYCSGACRRADRAKKSGVRDADRRIVFERDAWVCRLCSEPTEPDSDYLSDWYPTIDHIVPRSKGGADEVSNLRTAHRWCNSVRGDETYYTADVLVGGC